MADSRLPTHLEVAGLIRAAQDRGAFATVLQSGERDAGTLAILTTQCGTNAIFWERMPRLDGTRAFECTRIQLTENKKEFEDYLARRKRGDPDLWILELDGPDMERLVESWPR